MKLSFSLPSKSSASKQTLVKPSQNFDDNNVHKRNEDLDSKDFVSEFDPSKSLADANKKPQNFVIPPIQNEWRPFKKMKNLDLPSAKPNDSGLHFELESRSAANPDDSKISYGLNLRQATTKHVGETESEERPPQPVSVEALLLQKLKGDMQRLPDDGGFKDFEEVPIEGFGAALLAGYGWHEGQGVGKNAKEDVKVVQYEKRTDKEGLGFVSNIHSRPKREKEKEREKENGKVRERGRIGVVDRDEERGRERDGERGRERDEERGRERGEKNADGFVVGKHVRIVEGRDAGLTGRIVEKLSDNWLVLKLSKNKDHVSMKVLKDDVAELGSLREEKFLKKMKKLNISQDARKDESKLQKRSREADKVVVKQEEQKPSQVPWLTSHIRVRIISKDFKGGRLYLKKGEIVDVVGPRTCDISMDESRELIQGVSQDLLETALPRRGGPVLVLYGRHKGVYGSLVERDLDQHTGVLQDADSHSLVNVRLEQIAEFIGDPSYIGY